MSCRGQKRKAGGEARRRTAGFAFVLLVAHLAAARHHTASASATTAIGGENGVGVFGGSSRKGGVLSRSLQEETPSPSPGADDEETPVETPTPVAETDGGETPSPEGEGGETVETAAPVPQEASVEETPTPVPEEEGASDAPTDGASETPAPVAGEEGTPETPTPVVEGGSETPAPVAGDEGTPETPTPVAEGGSETAAPVAGEEGTPETPTPVVEEGTETPTPVVEEGTPETPTPAEEGTETPTPVVEEGTETPTPVVDEGPSAAPTGTATPLETSTSPTAGASDPVAPSTCSNGIPGVSDGDVCCLEACGQCGGEGCGAIAGTNGASDCCPDTIKEESGGVFCGEAPCVMAGFTPSPLNPAFDGTAAPVAPSTCSNGIAGYQDGAICCLEICGRCGGDGCGTIPGTGGSDNCCPSTILAAGVVCGEAPCIIEGYTPAPAVVGGGTTAPYGTSTCSNGILGYQDGPACCAANCGQCGGGGCGSVPGTAGASACCSSDVELAGNLCSATGVSPCVIDNYTPAPVVPDYGSAAPVVPSNCSNGLPGYQNNDICCLESGLVRQTFFFFWS
ncbi:expressed unknown protein [Ectocarpus siliculosus]|uniref:Uncharacterized protein n=1 Tax=Ectocarpus siliculosus TaxID=2880 RepID=D7FZM1_ECTSI|nr:expressed unknown protein [Ectocarpus siliculosus]|eukprot:CBJ32828.1 expressed unknown protein [Ectocarpus siliculosus]